MQAITLGRFGGIDELKTQSVPVPQAGPNEVLIRVEFAGVGVWDPFEREGGFAKMYGGQPAFPYILGTDGAGTVAAIGQQVTRFKEGDRVYAAALLNPKGGFYAPYAAVNADTVSRIPGKLTTEQAGVLMSDALTALRGLDEMLHLKQGQTVMVFGAGGGLGHLAVQLARNMGAKVFAVASGADGVELAKRLGADAAAEGRTQDIVAAARTFAPDGLDAALFTAGGEAADKAMAALRKGGRATHPNGVMPEPHAPPTVQLTRYDVEINRPMIEKLNGLIEAGPFEVHVARTFPLEQAADAQRALAEHYLGKLALRAG
jgi:NADPH:quinone reductase-like Zn-dependent oxidoreductase